MPLGPVAVSEEVPPTQTTSSEALALITGFAVTTITCDVLALQPSALVPITEYSVDVVGLTATADVWLPSLQVYVTAEPVTVRLTGWPLHDVGLLAAIVITGFVLVDTARVFVPIQTPVLPVTV